jgi:hypothetical protein
MKGQGAAELRARRTPCPFRDPGGTFGIFAASQIFGQFRSGFEARLIELSWC